jgi:hypothetical protein
MNDVAFSIINVPANLHVSYACPYSLQLIWNSVSGATGYEVSQLGSLYMDSIATVTDTTVILPINSTLDTWFSVRAIAPNDGKGRRALAIHKLPGVINCPLALNAASDSVLSPISGITFPCIALNAVPVTVKVRNGGTTTLTTFDISYSLNGGAPVTETYSGSLAPAATLNYTFVSTVDLSALTNYTVVGKVILAGDMNSNDDSVAVSGTVGSNTVAPITEDFEAAAFPPDEWQSVNPGNDVYPWRHSPSVTGKDGAPTLSAYIDNFGNSVIGSVHYLTTKLFDLSFVAYPLMKFDLAYAEYDTVNYDRMTIEVSTDCGASFNPSGYDKSGLALNTVPTIINNNPFTPTDSSQWREDSVDLRPFGGQSVFIRFTDINGYGNYLYVDNINIADSSSVRVSEITHVPAIGVYPNPSYGIFNVSLEDMIGQRIQIEVLDMQGRIVQMQTITNSSKKLKTTLDLSKYSKGIYNLRVSTEEKSYHLKLTLM